MAKCNWTNLPCCMRNEGNGEFCEALGNTYFKDHKCHFRKESPYGPNLYDKEKSKDKRRDK